MIKFVLIICLVLLFPVLVSADSNWVCWMKTEWFGSAGHQQASNTWWDIIGVAPDQSTCENNKKTSEAKSSLLQESGKKNYESDGAWSQAFRSLVCLPETIDPRDNKASPLPMIPKEKENEKPKSLYAAQSTITETEGNACMGNGKSRKQTEQAALLDAKKKAVEYVSTHIKSETQVKNFEIEKDLLSVYANAEVKVVQELKKAWYKDATYGDCYRIKIKAEIIPHEANAGTAWMKWEHETISNRPKTIDEWYLQDAYPTYEACLRAIRSAAISLCSNEMITGKSKH